MYAIRSYYELLGREPDFIVLTETAQEEDGEASHVIGGRYRIIEGVAMGGMGAVFKVV